MGEPERQLSLDDALLTLEAGGALTTGAVARQLQIRDRDARILMLTAQANRLVYSTATGEWAITERGRRTLQDFPARAKNPPN